MATSDLVGAPESVQLGARVLLAARAAEQITLAAVTVLIAAVVGPDRFAPIGVLLVVNSLAVTGSDWGVGLRIMRLPAGARTSMAAFQRVRLANFVITGGALGVGWLWGGSVGLVVAISGILWSISSEAFIRKSAALRWGAARRVAWAEIAGSVLLVAATACAVALDDHALGWVSVGLIGKHLVEVIGVGSRVQAFGEAVGDSDWLGIWLSQVVAFAIGNVDYLIVGWVLGERALATYLVAFRLANAVPSQVAFVFGRIATVDLASAGLDERERRYLRYTRILFLAGAAGALMTMLGSPIVQTIVGSDWTGAAWTLAVLALGAPWRTSIGAAGTLAIVSGRANELFGWEIGRLAAVTLALGVAASLGYPWFLAGVVGSAVASTIAVHRLAAGAARMEWWRPLGVASLGTVAGLMAVMYLGLDVLESVR